MGRAAPATWVLTLLGAVVCYSATGCSEPDTYCDRLRAADADFTALAAGDAAAFEDTTTFDDLVESAPAEVEDDWTVITETITTLRAALQDAGLTPQDLEDLDAGADLPEGVSSDDLLAAYDASKALNSQAFTAALDAVSTHAKDECNVEIQTS